MQVKSYLKFVIPSVLSMLIFQLYSMVDGIYIANIVGEEALSAVNISMPYVNCLFAFSILFATGTSTLVAIYKGRNEIDQARQLFTLNFVLLSIAGIVITVFANVFIDELAYFLGAGEDTIVYVKDYLGVLTYFSYFYIVSYSLEILVKTDGFPVISTIAIIVGAFTNIILDGVFMIPFHMGVFGASLATGMSQVLTFLVFFIHFIRKKGSVYFVPFQFDLSIYQKIIPLGLSDFFNELSAGLIVFVFNHVILKYIGENGIVTYTVITYIYNTVIMCFTGVSQGTQPQVSYYYGKKEEGRCKQLLKYGVCTIGAISLLSILVSFVGASFITNIFLDRNTALFSDTVKAIRQFSLCYLFAGYNILFAGYFASITNSRYSFTISLLRCFVLMIGSLLAMTFFFQDKGIWLSPLVNECLTFVVSLMLYRNTKNNLARSI